MQKRLIDSLDAIGEQEAFPMSLLVKEGVACAENLVGWWLFLGC